MIRLLWALSAHARYYLRRYMPTNILADAIRTRRGHKWGPAAMLLAGPYFLLAVWFVHLIDTGGPGWLHLLVLLAIWNGFKMLWLGPLGIAWLLRARGNADARLIARTAAIITAVLTVVLTIAVQRLNLQGLFPQR